MGEAANQGVEAAVDLFGNPLQPFRDPRGRPAYAKSKENQMLVVQLRALSWTHDQIAAFMGCDAKTLRKHFSRELDHGALFLEGMAMQVLVRRMMDGNVSAAKEVLAMVRPANAPMGDKDGKPKKPPVKGKKEDLNDQAARPPQAWGDLLQ